MNDFNYVKETEYIRLSSDYGLRMTHVQRIKYAIENAKNAAIKKTKSLNA